MRKGVEVSAPGIETYVTSKIQTVARVLTLRDKRNNAITTGGRIASKEIKGVEHKEIINRIVIGQVGITQGTPIFRQKGTPERAIFVKIKDTSKERVENIKDGVQKPQGQLKP